MSDGTGTTAYAYDALDRMTGISSPGGEQIGYDYDAVGNRVRVTYPGSEEVTYAYDADGHLQSVTTAEGTTTYIRDASGLPLRVDYPNGAYTTYDYDGAGRLVALTNGNTGGAFASYTFTLDAVGNQTRKVETLVEGGNTTVVTTYYAYDARDQLVDSVASDGVEAHYTFDPAGNRTQMTGVRQGENGLESYTVTYIYNAANQLLGADDSLLGVTTYAYNLNGARTVQQAAGQRIAYEYDAEDRLIRAGIQVPANPEDSEEPASMDHPYSLYLPMIVKGEGGVPDDPGDWIPLDGRAERYAYDGQSRRVSKWQVNPATDETLWERSYLYGAEWPVLMEYTSVQTDTINTRYVYDDELARLEATVGGVPSYLHYDHLGSAVGYTHADGALRGEDGLRRYGDYGDVLGSGTSWWTDTAYTGHERDSYTGLYYARHRYYDPEIGLWLTLDDYRGDSRNPLSQHRYAYVQSNPLNGVDPLGLISIRMFDAIMKAIEKVIESTPSKDDPNETCQVTALVKAKSTVEQFEVVNLARDAARHWENEKTWYRGIDPRPMQCWHFVETLYAAIGYTDITKTYLVNSTNTVEPREKSNLRAGDVFVWHKTKNHAEVYLGDRQIAHTRSDKGGLVIDQLGNEVMTADKIVRIIP